MNNNFLFNLALVFNILRLFLFAYIIVIVVRTIRKSYKGNNIEEDLIIKNIKNAIRYFLLGIIYLSIAIPMHNALGDEGDIVSFFILIWILIEIYKDYLKNRKTIITKEDNTNKKILSEQKFKDTITNQEHSIDTYSITKKSKIRPYIEYITQNMKITSVELNHNNKLRKINVQDLIDNENLEINSCTIQGKTLNEYRIPLVITIVYNEYLLSIKYNVGDKGIVRKFILDLDSELVVNDKEDGYTKQELDNNKGPIDYK